MSTEMANTDPTTTPVPAPVPAATAFQLTATNDSSVPGSRYFSVYPPMLTNLAAKSQILTALVSAPTSQTAPATTMTWNGGSGALNLFAFAGSISPDLAPRTAVALGDVVSVDWANGAFVLTPTAGSGPADGIEVTFTAAVPIDTTIGVVVGPGAIHVPQAIGQSPLTLTPDLRPVATVVFGTAFQLPPPNVWDVSRPQLVTFKSGGTSSAPTATAQISVGFDNVISDVT